MHRPTLVWAAAIGGLSALDIYAAYNKVEGDSLSECVRTAFHTDTPAGRAVILCGWAALTAWVLPHWCKVPLSG